ncbi:MAG: TPM domain-containing protein [Oscillospiraceae bacterium]
MKKCRKLLPALIFAVMMITAALLTITASADVKYSVAIDDLDNCLTPEEENSLLQIMQKTADKTKLNIGFCITADLEGMSDEIYSDYYSDEHFGHGSDSVVLLMVNTYDKPQYAAVTDEISTSGVAVGKFSKSIIENNMFPRIYKGFDNTNATSVGVPKSNVYKGYSSAQFYQAGVGFCEAIETFSNPFVAFWATIGDYIAKNVTALVIGIIIATIFALMVANSTKAKYSKKKPISADKYLDRRNTRVVRQVDRFVREYTTSVRISSSSSGGGRSGGGGGGHSSGHGGGGGRHR